MTRNQERFPWMFIIEPMCLIDERMTSLAVLNVGDSDVATLVPKQEKDLATHGATVKTRTTSNFGACYSHIDE